MHFDPPLSLLALWWLQHICPCPSLALQSYYPPSPIGLHPHVIVKSPTFSGKARAQERVMQLQEAKPGLLC